MAMKTTIGWGLSVLAGGALLGAITAAAPAGTAAQQSASGPTHVECRCVDRSGKEIPNCACFRMPPTGDFVVSGFGHPAARARLGIAVSVTQDAADDAEGARVQSVLRDGPAASAGIRRGDIITSVNGRSLSAKLDSDVEKDFDHNESLPVQRLLSIVNNLDPNTQVPVSYLRDGKAHTTMVHTEDLSSWVAEGNLAGPEARMLRKRMSELRDRLDSLGPHTEHEQWRLFAPGRGRLGIFREKEDTLGTGAWRCPDDGSSGLDILSNSDECIGELQLVKMNPGLASYFKTGKGVLVSDVGAGSSTGLRPGDVIVRIGDRAAENPDRARRILASYAATEPIAFHIVRKGKAMEVTGHLGG